MSLNQVAFFVLFAFLRDDNLVDEKDLAVVVVVVAAAAAKQALSADVFPVASVLLILEEVDAMVAVVVAAVAADHRHYT
jgi:hypothetical protein